MVSIFFVFMRYVNSMKQTILELLVFTKLIQKFRDSYATQKSLSLSKYLVTGS